MKGVANIDGQDAPLFMEVWYEQRRLRRTVDVHFREATISVLDVVNEQRAWRKTNNEKKAASPEDLAEYQHGVYEYWVTTLVPLLEDTGFRLRYIRSEQAKEGERSGVRVHRQGFQPVDLYFEADTGLLASVITKRVDKRGRETVTEERRSEYRKMSGVLIAGKLMRLVDGVRNVEAHVVHIRLLTSIEAHMFAEP